MRLLFALVLCTFSLAARADSFLLNFNDGSANSVTLNGDLNAAKTAYLITSASGTIDGNSISLSPLGTFGSSNLLYFPAGNGGYLDTAGITFYLAQDSLNYNLFFGPFQGVSGYHYTTIGEAIFDLDTVTITPNTVPSNAITPEPGTFVLLGSGIFGVVGAARRRLA